MQALFRVRMRGLEPPRSFLHTDLNRARLPIPPHPRAAATISHATLPATLASPNCPASSVVWGHCGSAWGRRRAAGGLLGSSRPRAAIV